MTEIWAMGEILVEIMRSRPDVSLYETDDFRGPYPSGAPAIFLDTVARLGHSAGIIGGVGDDGFGRKVVDRLSYDGVRTDYVSTVRGKSTAVAFVTYSSTGDREFIFHIDGTPAVEPDLTRLDQIADAKIFHVMGCSLMANPTFRAAIIETGTKFRSKGAKISLDPNIRPELLAGRDVMEVLEPILEQCSVLLPGVKELEMITGQTKIADSIRFLFETTPIEIVVVKLGKQGCSIYTPTERVDVAGFVVAEVDPTGAGDCFDAGFMCGLLEEKSLYDSGVMAAAAGALNAEAFGPMEGDLQRATLDAFIRDRRGE